MALLRAVTIDRNGLQPQPPAFGVGTGNVLWRGLPRHVDRFGNCSGDEWLGSSHHGHMGSPLNGPFAQPRLEGTVKDRQVLLLDFRTALDGVVLVDVGEYILNRGLVVSQFPQSQWHGLVDNFQHAATGELLVLHQGDVGLDAGCVTVHQEADGPGWGQYRRLGVPEAIGPASGQHIIPDPSSGIFEGFGAGCLNLFDGIAVHLHHIEHWLTVGCEAFERADRTR